MSFSITRTKVIRPRRARDLLSRPRLLGMLDDLLEYRLALIAAPAGYGKTTLLVDFASQAPYPVCWLSLDPLDSSPLRFISYLVAAIHEQFPSFGGPSRSLLSNLKGAEVDQDRILHTIVNDLYENIEEHFALVLDDFHLIESSPGVSSFINRFAQEVDENCHLVIASRSLLSLPDLPLMIGRSQVKGLSFEELAFHPDEIRELYWIKYQQEMSSQQAESAAAETEGWITGLLLTAETTRDHPTDHSRAAKAAGIDIYDYLAGQVLDQQTPEMGSFLLRSALLEEFDAGLCQEAFGNPAGEHSWNELIQQLLRMNLFIQPVEDGGTWLRYHHLFGDFLRQRCREDDPEGTQALLKSLVGIYSAKGWWEKAYGVCQQLGDDKVKADFIEQASTPLAHSGRLNLLNSWLSDLHPDLILERPLLLAQYAGILITSGKYESAMSWLNQVLEGQRSQEDQTLPGLLYLRRATINRLLGEHQAGLENAHIAYEISTTTKNDQILSAESEREIGLNQRRLGNIQEAKKHLESSRTLYLSQKDHNNAALVEMDLGFLAMSGGKYPEARKYFQQASKLWEELGNLIQLVGLCNNLGVLEHLCGEYAEAHDWFKRGLKYANQISSTRYQAFTLASLADLALDLDALGQAESYINEAVRLASKIGESFLQGYLRISRALLAVKGSQLEKAKIHLDAAESFIRNNPSGIESGKFHYEWGYIWLQEGQLELAREEFITARELFSRSGSPVEEAVARILLARVEDLLGQGDASQEQLGLAGEILNSLGTITPVVPRLSGLAEGLQSMGDTLPSDHYLFSLLRAIREFQNRLPGLRESLGLDITPAQAESMPELEITSLGRELVRRQGKPIDVPEWTKQKTVRELFFYLLSQPEGATREEICLVFWPDSDQEQLSKQFKNAIYRLRRAIGSHAVLYHVPTRLYHFNRRLSYRYDVEDFRAALLAAENETDPESKLHYLQEAVAIYRHPYVPSMEGIWAEPKRYRLYLAYEEALLELARLQESRGDTIGALESTEKLLAVNPGQEAASRIAMRSYAARGDRAGVERVFQACRQGLDQALDAEPSQKTHSLYQKLMG